MKVKFQIVQPSPPPKIMYDYMLSPPQFLEIINLYKRYTQNVCNIREEQNLGQITSTKLLYFLAINDMRLWTGNILLSTALVIWQQFTVAGQHRISP